MLVNGGADLLISTETNLMVRDNKHSDIYINGVIKYSEIIIAPVYLFYILAPKSSVNLL